MALQTSGPISMGDIADEIGESKSNLSLANDGTPSQGDGSLFGEAFGGSNGVDKNSPHSLSEFYGYDHYTAQQPSYNGISAVKADSAFDICYTTNRESVTIYSNYTSLSTTFSNGGTIYILSGGSYNPFKFVYPNDNNVSDNIGVTHYPVTFNSTLQSQQSC